MSPAVGTLHHLCDLPFCLKQAGAYQVFTVLGDSFLDLAKLRCGQRAVVRLVLRQQFDGQFVQRLMDGKCSTNPRLANLI